MLKAEIETLNIEGFELEILGFDDSTLQKILDEPNFEAGTEDDQGKLDQLEPKMIACPKCQHEFDSREATA